MAVLSAPSAYLNWTPSGLGSNVVQPPSGVSNTGWTALQSPPYQYINYLFWLTDQWIQYLAGVALVPATAATLTASSVAATTTGTYTIGSNVMTIASATDVYPGMTIGATIGGIPANTTVLAISGTTLTMSANATATEPNTPVTFSHTLATGGYVQLQLDVLDAYVTNLEATLYQSATVNFGVSLATAIASLPATGGVIVVIGNVAQAASVTLPANTKVIGKGLGSGFTISSSVGIVMGANCALEDLTLSSSSGSAVTLVSAAGANGKVRNCTFTLPSTNSSAIGLDVLSEGLHVETCVFTGVLTPSVATGLKFELGSSNSSEAYNVYSV